MSIEEQKRDLIEEKNKQTERERELNLWERKLEERKNSRTKRRNTVKYVG